MTPISPESGQAKPCLVRHLPDGRQEVLYFDWVHLDVSRWGSHWGITSCWWCEDPFQEDDDLSLAVRNGKTVTLCEECAMRARQNRHNREPA